MKKKWEVEVGPEGIESALDNELKKVVGVGAREFERAMAVSGNMPMRMFTALLHLVDTSGVLEKLAEWDKAERKSPVGRKALISFRAVLVVELMTVLWNKGVQYQEIADTYAHRLTVMQFNALGVKRERVGRLRWLHRHWRAKSRLLALVDPYHHMKKNKKLSLEAATHGLAAKDEVRQERLNWIIQALVDASVGLLPQRYRDAYSGDVALDSTRIRVLGRVHSRAFTLAQGGKPLNDPEVIAASRTLLPGGILTNADFTAGTYMRQSQERPSKVFEPAHELDFVTMMDVKGYDEHPAFARLITAMSIHRPGAIKHGPRRAMQAHSRMFEQRGICAADRAFNGSDAENLQLPLREDNWEMAFDYKKDQFGLQGAVPGTDVVVIDGVFYVNRMLRRHVDGISWYKNGEPDPDTGKLLTWDDVQVIIEERLSYQMVRHGSMEAENKQGAQRFTYPDPETYQAFDPVTQDPIPARRNKLRGSVRIKPDASFVKHLQRHPWGTAKWAAAYGQRNQVESSNSTIKRSRFIDIEDPQKRSGRGVAFHGLASALMVFAHNVRALVRALVEEHTQQPSKKAPTASPSSQRPTWTLTASELDALEPPGEETEAA